MNWLEQLAPTLATALLGPFAGLAVETISKVMGINPDQVKETIESGKLTSDQLTQLKEAETQIKARAQELGLDFEKLAVDDRKSARDMQSTTRSYLPPILAVLVTLGFFGILLSLMYGAVAKTEEVMIMLGSLGTAWTGIIAFYFGSSAGSQAKDRLLQQSIPK
jgi:hypothetical protein